MTEDQNTNNTQSVFLKRLGLYLKEKGFNVKPLPESTELNETILVNKEDLVSISKFLKNDENCSFDLLISVSAVDLIKEELLESVYHLFSTKFLHKLVLKVRMPRQKPQIPSVCSVWITADWHEREAYDLMGIEYSGHPNLKRILLPNDWIGHPLRKDYVQKDERLIWNER